MYLLHRNSILLLMSCVALAHSNGFFSSPTRVFNSSTEEDQETSAQHVIYKGLGYMKKFSVYWLNDDTKPPGYTQVQIHEDSPDCSRYKFRNYDGWCNNVERPLWGAAFMPYTRLLPPDYADKVEAPRRASDGGPLPGARLVSIRTALNFSDRHPHYSGMFPIWGQMINHDVTSKLDTPGVRANCFCEQPEEERHPDCWPIMVPPEDEFNNYFGRKCIIFVRAVPYTGNEYNFPFREQFNNNTAYIDASPVYGSEEGEALKLRSFEGGKLKNIRVRGKELLPFRVEGFSFRNCERLCFVGGDSRVNMVPPLTALHVILLRHHNRITDILSDLNPHWDDERLYQETRNIIAAQFQHITYKEYLPLAVGKDLVKHYTLRLQKAKYFHGYNPKIDAGAFNVFVTAAYRFGHSQIGRMFRKSAPDHSRLPTNRVSREFFLSTLQVEPGPGPIAMGICDQRMQETDHLFTDQLTNNLFVLQENFTIGTGADLFSVNVQRGRDNGIPSYTAWREYCGLEKPRSFHDLRGLMPDSIIEEFMQLYRDVDDIDIFPAGIAEYNIPGAAAGPTFACLIGQQFQHLRLGDRFWYENGGQPGSFTPDQLEEIRKTTLARIMCENTDDIHTIQPHVMEYAEHESERVPCDFLEALDLRPWKEEYHP